MTMKFFRTNCTRCGSKSLRWFTVPELLNTLPPSKRHGLTQALGGHTGGEAWACRNCNDGFGVMFPG